MRTHREAVLVALITAIGCAGPRAVRAPAPPASPVVARVNGDVITASELKTEFGQSHEGHSKFLIAGEVEARAFLGKLVDKRLLLQEAARMGLTERSDIREEVGQFEAEQATRYLVKKEIEEPQRTTDADVQRAYDEQITHVIEAREIRCETKADAEKALARIRAGEEFDFVAREVSTAPTHVYGGLLQNVGWGAKSPEWEAVAFATPVGETSEVFRTDQGWEIVKVQDRKAAKKPDLEAARAKIRTILESRRQAELDRKLRAALWAKYRPQLAEPPAADLLAKVAAAEAAHEHDPAGDTTVATWDGGKLAVSELAQQVKAPALAKLAPEKYARVVADLLTQSVYGRLARQEAAARGYAKVPEVAQMVRDRREKLTVDMILLDYVVKGITVTEEDAKAFFDANPAAFGTPEVRDVSHIQVDTLEAAKEVQALLASGKPFDEVARTHSKNEATKALGGSLGLVTRNDSPREFAQVFSLKVGETTEPVEGKGGYHIIRVNAIQPAQPAPYDVVKGEVLTTLRKKRKTDALASWTKRLRAVSTISIDEAALKEFVKASEAEAEELSKGPPSMSSDHTGMGGGSAGGPHGGASHGAGPHGGAPAGAPSDPEAPAASPPAPPAPPAAAPAATGAGEPGAAK